MQASSVRLVVLLTLHVFLLIHPARSLLSMSFCLFCMGWYGQASGREEASKLSGGSRTADDAVLQQAFALKEQNRAEKRRRDGAASAKLGPKKDKAKGPNPLSVMKKKKAVANHEPSGAAAAGSSLGEESSEAGPKKNRRRKKARGDADAAASDE